MATTINLSEEKFDQVVLQNEKLVFVDFWAPWCGPCKVLAPVVDELASEFQGKIVFCKVNVDEFPSIATDYNIRSLPTILIFKNLFI